MISDPIILSEAEAARLVLDFYHMVGVERETFEHYALGARSGESILAEIRDAIRRRDDERNRIAGLED